MNTQASPRRRARVTSRLARAGASLRRVTLQALPTVVGIVILNFLLLQLVPGDAADVIAGEAGSATAESMAMVRAQFGLDQPMLAQLMDYLTQLSHFSLGYSPRFNAPVATLIMSRLPNTLALMGSALAIAIVIGVALGAVMAAWPGRWSDRLISFLVLVMYSAPGFWIGLMAIVVFSVHLGWFPSGGNMTIAGDLHSFAWLRDRLNYMVLPALSLATIFMAIYARLTRASMLEVARQDFVRTARSKGLHPFQVQLRHILKNALIPITTMAGIHLGNLLGGAVVVETVFGWPGMGRLALEAVAGRDYKVLLGVLLLASMLVVAANALIDLLQAWLDPRIEVR